MKIVVLADDSGFDFLKTVGENVTWTFTNDTATFFTNKDADAYFDVRTNAHADYSSLAKPIFINSMAGTLAENKYAKNVLRINAWPGFTETDMWELAGMVNDEVKDILQQLHKKYIVVPDEPGFVSARIIAMIINEAYFALDEQVSTKKDIDIAMKLGTNYPFGPFEWCEKIGVNGVYALLQKLSLTDNRFSPSAGIATANKNI